MVAWLDGWSVDRNTYLPHTRTPPPQILAKPKISTGKKIDATMDKVRVGLFFRDLEVTKENLEKAKKLIEDVRGLPGQGLFQRRVLGWGGGGGVVVDCRGRPSVGWSVG